VKMKMSIIIGVLQMTVGLVLHLMNAIEFKRVRLDGFFEFLPRLIFLEAIFGYLCFMIFYKWGVDYIGNDAYNQQNRLNNATQLKGTGEAPVLLNELIYMFLQNPDAHDDLYDGQSNIQLALVAIAFISIPWMMCFKPCILKYQNDSRIKKMPPPVTTEIVREDEESTEEVLEDEEGSHREVDTSKGKGKEKEIPTVVPVGRHDNGEEEEEEFQFGEIMIHQLLETIEFILGSVSHTASYLRLWALSLAHAELATVFWEKIMYEVLSVTVTGPPRDAGTYITVGLITFAGFSVWFMVTLLVMMFMELLSALLHALRLHWVEFQSKFYKGDGYPFIPFAMRKVYSANRLPDFVHTAS